MMPTRHIRTGSVENGLLLVGALAILLVFGVSFLVTGGNFGSRAGRAEKPAKKKPPAPPPHSTSSNFGSATEEGEVVDAPTATTEEEPAVTVPQEETATVETIAFEPRTWTAVLSGGRTSEAEGEFVALESNGEVVLRINDNEKRLPLFRLSVEDQAYIVTIVQKHQIEGRTIVGTAYLESISELDSSPRLRPELQGR